MISTLSIVYMFITLIICFVVPAYIALRFNSKYKVNVGFFIAGFFVFLIFERVTRMPFLKMMEDYSWYNNATSSPLGYALFMGITAALFEEAGRYLYYKVIVRDRLSWANGVAFGIGFGGIQAMVVTGGVYTRQLIFSIMLNRGKYGSVDELMKNPEIAKIINQIQNVKPYMHLLLGLERLFMIFIQIAFSVLTIFAAKSKKAIYLLLVVFIHTAVITLAVLLDGFNIWIAQFYLLIVAILGVWFVLKTSKKEYLFKIPEQG